MPLDAHSKAFLDALAEKGVKPFHQMEVHEARNFMEGLRDIIGPGPEMYRVDDISLDQGGTHYGCAYSLLQAPRPGSSCTVMAVDGR